VVYDDDNDDDEEEDSISNNYFFICIKEYLYKVKIIRLLIFKKVHIQEIVFSNFCPNKIPE
jgi:hypothetical protein